MKKSIILVLGILFVIFNPIMTVTASTLPEASTDFYVYDEADIIDSEVENFILNVNRNYENTDEQPQIVVAAVESLDGLSVEEYATELFTKWKIGQEDSDNGVLLLISESDREIRIEVGYGLEGAITDASAGRMIDRQMDALGADDYSTAVEGIFTNIAQSVNEEYGYDQEEILGFVPEPQESSSDSENNYWIILVVLILFVGRFIGGNRGGRGRGGGFGGGYYGGFGGGSSNGGSSGSFGGGGMSGGGGSSRGF
ncbi:YgcG family protein [Marinilactibacillus psychrotolerans]|uniref:TPM domain-containing protein n=1 Tax=Marinilactibacillus psychrotolerans TaxID=191770 RepID=UPI00381F5381